MKISGKIFLVVFGLFLLNSCKNGDSDITFNPDSQKSAYKGGNKVVRIAELSAPVSLFPHTLTQATEGLISGQIFEGLVLVDPKTLEVKPGLAESWKVADDGKSIEFTMRRGVKFQKTGVFAAKDVEVSAEDVKFTFELLCTYSDLNYHFATVCKDRIVGANEKYEASMNGKNIPLSGFKVIDNYTFKIELLNSPAIFLDILGCPAAAILSKEAYELEKEKTLVGAGPFILDTKNSTESSYRLYKNMDYYGRDSKNNPLPYLDSVIVKVVPSSEVAWEGFNSGYFDYINSLPANQLARIVEENIASFKGNPAKYVLDRSPEMVTQYYLFNTHKPPFNDVRVRKAFNHAIDRDRIIDRVLFGQAYGPAIFGIVPPTFDYYKSGEVEGYKFDLNKAKKLLAEAGYPEGKNFPEIKLIVNSGNLRNNTVAAEIQKQLNANLGVNVNFESLPNADKFNLQTRGEGDLFRDGWIADYPSPESFLSIFYGEPVDKTEGKVSYPNTTKYVNPEYDKFYKMGRDAIEKDSAAKYFLMAEKILMNDAPLIPLYYESNYRLISSRLLNFHVNPLRHYDFSEVDVRY